MKVIIKIIFGAIIAYWISLILREVWDDQINVIYFIIMGLGLEWMIFNF